MRKSGKATTAEQLKSWPTIKLTQEIAKQIRMDCGGQEARTFLKRKAQESFAVEDATADKITAFAYDFAFKQLLGSRKRTRSKIRELQQRINDEPSL